MAIRVIKGTDGTTSITAANKIKVYYLNKLKQNPWLIHRESPYQSEALSQGGGSYTYYLPLGVDVATRRSSDAITNNTITYDGVIKNKNVNLTVSEPFMTKAYSMFQSDTIQLDGINYSPIVSEQLTESLVAAEINAETDVLLTDTDILSVEVEASTKLEQLEGVKQKIANYFDIASTNTDWAGATSDIKAYDYFTAQKGSFNESEIVVHMHPSKIMDFSNAVTNKGAGSDMQFKEFTSGDVPFIGGVRVISNKYMPADKVAIIPVGKMTATPDPDLMLTKVNSWYDEGNDLNAMKGWHWFDAKALRPELLTLISFTTPAE